MQWARGEEWLPECQQEKIKQYEPAKGLLLTMNAVTYIYEPVSHEKTNKQTNRNKRKKESKGFNSAEIRTTYGFHSLFAWLGKNKSYCNWMSKHFNFKFSI